ncbi:MAG: Gfo/Idh/MocA family oxidoreductase [Kiritimatiellaeota bacterium]|nr:Gfo/Idh/MocA family oxidoreductase [Kiritimatiellota bacterium]
MELSRRGFIRKGMATGAVLGFPAIVPARVLGQEAPSKKIQVGIIGCGRIAESMDIPGVWYNKDLATIVALSDPDTKRMRAIRERTAKLFEGDLPELKLYQQYKEMLADSSVDAVMICTPDHWHAQQCVEAALAKKDVYVQKPLALSVFESRSITDVVKKTGCVFHLGTQQRSEGKGTSGPHFRKAAEYVRNGRIGRVTKVEIGLPGEPDEPELPLEQPVPDTFDYDLWLGCAPLAPFSELRTHPQGKGAAADFGRPGWMSLEAYDLGMIANWGAHHIDILQWALGMERSGPVKVESNTEFPQRRLWDVHGKLDVRLEYANGIPVHLAGLNTYPNGVRFIGEEGWIFCSRGSEKAISNVPSAGGQHGLWRPLEASAANVIEGEVEKPLARNPDNHHRPWFTSIRSRQPTTMPVETAHYSTTACIVAYIAMKRGIPLTWDPKAERFVNDAAANAMLTRAERAPYGTGNVLNVLKER